MGLRFANAISETDDLMPNELLSVLRFCRRVNVRASEVKLGDYLYTRDEESEGISQLMPISEIEVV